MIITEFEMNQDHFIELGHHLLDSLVDYIRIEQANAMKVCENKLLRIYKHKLSYTNHLFK